MCVRDVTNAPVAVPVQAGAAPARDVVGGPGVGGRLEEVRVGTARTPGQQPVARGLRGGITGYYGVITVLLRCCCGTITTRHGITVDPEYWSVLRM